MPAQRSATRFAILLPLAGILLLDIALIVTDLAPSEAPHGIVAHGREHEPAPAANSPDVQHQLAASNPARKPSSSHNSRPRPRVAASETTQSARPLQIIASGPETSAEGPPAGWAPRMSQDLISALEKYSTESLSEAEQLERRRMHPEAEHKRQKAGRASEDARRLQQETDTHDE